MATEDGAAAAAETPYELARRLHEQGTDRAEVERALRALGLDEEEARIAARAGRGEAGVAPAAPVAGPAREPEAEPAPPTEPPAHPCPTHAAWPVVATCGRCGKFICARCVAEAGWLRLPASNQCPECEARAPVLQGIGGWLILPALHIAVVAPLSGGAALLQDVLALRNLSGSLLAPVLVEAFFYAAYLAFALFTALAFFQKKQRAVSLMIIFYVLAIVSALLSIALTGWISGITGEQVGDKDDGVQTGRAMVTSVIWIAYFLQSKRVKATFVVP